MDRQPQAPTPAARITVLLKLAGEGFEDAFSSEPVWVEAPAGDYQELRDVAGPQHLDRLHRRIGLRQGEAYRAGGPAGTVTLTPAALDGVLGLIGLAALPPDVLVDDTPDGPRYRVPDTWFESRASDGSDLPERTTGSPWTPGPS